MVCYHVDQENILVDQTAINVVIMILQEETLNLCLAAAPEVTTAVLEQVKNHSLIVIVIINFCQIIVIVNHLQFGK